MNDAWVGSVQRVALFGSIEPQGEPVSMSTCLIQKIGFAVIRELQVSAVR